MKFLKFLTIVLCCSALSFFSCNENKKDTKKDTKQDTLKPTKVVDSTTPSKAATTNPTTKEPAQSATGVWHYTCSIGCAGGAGSAVKCETCGNMLVHNTTYHAKANTTTSSAPFANPPAPAPEPSQNAAGVWHYTCTKGCAGGAGAAGSCSTCGGPLTHNTAYH